MILLIILTIIVLLISLKIYQKLTCGICKCSTHLVGKVVIVTGSNSGIGFETALNLAERGARVLLACRSEKRGLEACDRIIEHSGNGDVHFRHLDLASLFSVREFANNINKTEKRLDILINNAASGGLGNFITNDELHIGMQVNYFGPFLLTNLLLPLLKSSGPSRIINVSSIVHKYGVIDFANLNMEKQWDDFSVYKNSKLFMNLMTLELSDRLRDTQVTANCLHPGIAATNIFRHIPNKIVRVILERFLDMFFKNSWEAAQTSIYLAVSPEVNGVSGRYFSDCRETMSSTVASDPLLAKRLWAVSEKLVQQALE